MNNETLIYKYKEIFKDNPTHYIDTGGRFEICGNHTDHNHGLCLVANCSLRVKAILKENKDKVKIKSEGYDYFEFDINDLSKKEEENHTTLALAKGILFKLKELGYKIGGFSAYITSEIPDGSGVSSSAAMESLFGFIISYLYNDGKIPNLVIAQVGQFSENNYFSKQCGLLDQIGTSFDSANYIDFKDIKNPKLENLPFNLPVTLYLIKSLGDHKNLTPLYEAIPNAMYKVANLLENKQFLRDIDETNIYLKIDSLNVSDEIKRKAKHFFIENQNVLAAKEAILNNDLEKFFDAIKKSQESSKLNIENTYVKGEYIGSPQHIADEVSEFIKDNGAIRIHGGGFKGTTLTFIKNEFVDEFDKFLASKYDSNRYYKVTISNKCVNFKKI